MHRIGGCVYSPAFSATASSVWNWGAGTSVRLLTAFAQPSRKPNGDRVLGWLRQRQNEAFRERQNRMIAVLASDTLLNLRIGSGISVAAELLSVEDSERLLEIRGCRWLFDPPALRIFLIRPSHEARCGHLRNAAGCAAMALHVEIAGSGSWLGSSNRGLRHLPKV